MLRYRFLRTERGTLQPSLFTEFIKTVSSEHLTFFFLGYLHERLQIHFFDKSVTTSPICWLIVSKDSPLSLRLTTIFHTLFLLLWYPKNPVTQSLSMGLYHIGLYQKRHCGLFTVTSFINCMWRIWYMFDHNETDIVPLLLITWCLCYKASVQQ